MAEGVELLAEPAEASDAGDTGADEADDAFMAEGEHRGEPKAAE